MHGSRSSLSGLLIIGMVALTLLALVACGPASVATASPSLSPSTTETPTATSRPTPDVPSGWQRIEVADRGFAIALPDSWQIFDLTSDEIDQMLAPLEDDPALAGMVDQITQLVSSGGALFALDASADAVEAGFITNLNVLVQEDAGSSLSILTAANVSYIEQNLNVEVEQTRLQVPAGDASRLLYQFAGGAFGKYHVTQYFLVGGGDLYVVTFSRAIGAEFEELETLFEASMETFELLQ